MKDLLFLSAMFGWPVAVFALYRMSTLDRCSSHAMRWGYAFILAGSLLQATSGWVLNHPGSGLLFAARALIVGLMALCAGLALLVTAYAHARPCAADGTPPSGAGRTGGR